MIQAALIFKRPGIVLSGLLVFILIPFPVMASDCLLIDILSRLTLESTQNTLPGQNFFAETDISYSPLIKEKKRSDNDNFNSFLDIMNGGARIQWGNEKLRSRTSYKYNKYEGAVRIDSTRYSTCSYMKSHRLETSLWLAARQLNTGILLGAIFPDDSEMKLKTFKKKRFSVLGNLYPGLYANAMLSPFTFRVNLEKQPLITGTTKLIKNSRTESYRTFPLVLCSYRAGTGADFKAENIILSLDFSADAIRSNPENELKSSMPVDLGMNLYRVSHSVTTALKRSNLFWSTEAILGGGLCEVYTKNTDGMNFFLADSIRLRTVNVSCGIKDSIKFGFKGHGSLFSLHSPTGFLNLAPFSEWTIFQPVNYRFYNASFLYSDIGCTSSKAFIYNNYTFILELGIRYFTLSGECGIKKRETVILFPRYEDLGKKQLMDVNGLFFTPRISVPLKIFTTNFSLELDGVIPVLFNDKKPKTGTTEGSEKKNLDTGDLTGGIRMGMHLDIPLMLKH